MILKLLSTEEPNQGSKKGQRLWQQAVILCCPKVLNRVVLYTAFMLMNKTSWRLSSEILLYFNREYLKVVESDIATPLCEGSKGRA